MGRRGRWRSCSPAGRSRTRACSPTCSTRSASLDGGRARTRPERVLADKGYPSKKNRAWLRERGIKATIPERDDQIEKRRKRPGRPIDFGDEQQERYKGRNVIERCFSFVKQWRGLAARYDKTARSYAAGLCLSAALQWI
nr:transposase [Nocardiopsis composta]